MITKTMLLIFIGVSLAITAAMIAWEWWRDHQERESARKAALARDMRSMDERRKRELIRHNREQLALEYLNREEEAA